MASSTYQQQPFPAVPPSMSAGEHEMRDYHASQDAPRPTTNQTPDFKPYLGLRARLSQIWINRWTILLLLVLVRLMFSFASVDSSLSSARREALSACTQVENIGSSMASMPHYMSKGINEMTATSVEKAVSGLIKMLEMSVTGVEEMIIFVISMLVGTYACLITLAVEGSMKLAIDLAENIQKLLDKTINEATDEMADGVKSVMDGINGLVGKINLPNPFGDGGGERPQINLDGTINKLKSLKVPSEMTEGIQKMKEAVPNYDEVRQATEDLIRLPFKEVKKLINGLRDDFEFDRSVLPVPQKERLTFCTDGNSINSFFDDLIKMVYTGKKIALAVLIVAAVLVCAPMAWQEIRRYRKMQERAALANEGHDSMDVVYLASRPTSSGIGLWFGRRFGSARRQAIIRWAWAYATSTPMLFLLSLGAAGLFSCLCQYMLLKSIEDKAPELTQQVADFAGKVVLAVNNASMSWSNGVNSEIVKIDTKINDNVFGWVNETTGAVSSTLDGFMNKINGAVDKALGGTPLKDPVQGVLRCLIGLKVESVQKGLAWVRDNAHVSFPGVSNDTFSLAAVADKSDSDSAADLLANPTGKAKDEVTEAITYVIEKFMSGIQTEALISTALIVIWLLIAIGGYIYAGVHLVRRDPYTDRDYHIDPATISESKPQDQDYDAAAAPPSYVANDYNVNKAAPYTLNSRPFPTFDAEEDESEKVGQVSAHRDVNTSSRPGHLRASSHGDLADPSPLDERTNPFSDRSYPREK